MRKALATAATLALIGALGAAPLASALAAGQTPAQPRAMQQSQTPRPAAQQSQQARAGQHEMTGTIKSVNERAGTFTLTDGQSFTAAPNLRLADQHLKAGEKVRITYEVKGGKWMADAVHPAS